MNSSMSGYLRTWYTANTVTDPDKGYAFPMVQQAFQEGVAKFAAGLTGDVKKVELAERVTNIQDIQALACESFAKYSDGQTFPRTRKWLQRAISRMHHYGNIIDVLVQHHPEYAALAWGAMKLVLVAAQNHEATICLVSKALSQIADTLPRVELAAILYPTERMRRAVGNLYANLLRFFIRAHDWCREGTFRHLLHSITCPVELRYKDLLEDIAANSREIDQLATSGNRVEIREMNFKLSEIAAKLDSFHALHSSSLLDTNQRLSDLQFSQIMSHIAVSKLGDPLEAYRYNQSLQLRGQHSQAFESTNKFWQSPKLHAWSSGPESNLAVIRGGFSARFAMRRFSVNMIQQLQSKNVPVLWALRGPGTDSNDGEISIIDIFKHLILQAFRLEQDSMTENKMSLQSARFHRATTERDWLQLLGSALLRAHSQVYVVIDLSTLNCGLLPPAGFSWLTACQHLFAEMSKQSPNLQVKVLIVGDRVNYGLQESEQVPSDMMIPVRVTQTLGRRRRRRYR